MNPRSRREGEHCDAERRNLQHPAMTPTTRPASRAVLAPGHFDAASSPGANATRLAESNSYPPRSPGCPVDSHARYNVLTDLESAVLGNLS